MTPEQCVKSVRDAVERCGLDPADNDACVAMAGIIISDMIELVRGISPGYLRTQLSPLLAAVVNGTTQPAPVSGSERTKDID